MKSLTLHGSLVLAALTLASLAPSVARADHALYGGFGGGFVNDFDCCAVHGRIQGEFGIHFDHEDYGFVLAFEAWGTFGPQYDAFTGGARLGYDINVHADRHFQLLLRPSGFIGIGARDVPGPDHWFGNVTLQPAFDARFVFANRLIALWVRPLAFDLMIWWDPVFGRDSFSAAYQFMGGIDFQF